MARDLNQMTEREINGLIFGKVGTATPVGILQEDQNDPRGLTGDEVLRLPDHPCWAQFSWSFRSWVWAAINEIVD